MSFASTYSPGAAISPHVLTKSGDDSEYGSKTPFVGRSAWEREGENTKIDKKKTIPNTYGIVFLISKFIHIIIL